MNKSIIIPIHSFVDLITNSSSEIFVSADQNTVKAIKKLVSGILTAGGSTKSADDLFEFELGYRVFTDKGDEIYMTKKEISEKKKELKAKLESDGEIVDEYYEDEQELGGWEFCYESEYGYERSGVRVTAKNNEDKATAKILSSLTDLFGIEATMN
jgi:hypothetical protein